MAWYHAMAKWYWKVRKPLTLGVRLIVDDEQKGVLLIRHTYVSGWYLPGGGVEKGETFWNAARRELREECGLTVTKLKLCHLYYSEREGKRDHIALFHASAARSESGGADGNEVREMRYFLWDQLPADMTPSTRKRLEEFRAGSFQEERW
ncbi:MULTISPECIES: NUDIX domain-containing protein [Brevibacillus]|uniref:NUDIX domain-containing protein n=1 Tax=Brevibacillus TaxID=55080 RepID=UPI000EE36BFE|nr:NUDIX domain-containing protein [Brevibacillus sp.]HBZ82649.1 ADP-ribose pyrophosphatase [Brevibacillus sp.]